MLGHLKTIGVFQNVRIRSFQSICASTIYLKAARKSYKTGTFTATQLSQWERYNSQTRNQSFGLLLLLSLVDRLSLVTKVKQNPQPHIIVSIFLCSSTRAAPQSTSLSLVSLIWPPLSPSDDVPQRKGCSLENAPTAACNCADLSEALWPLPAPLSEKPMRTASFEHTFRPATHLLWCTPNTL